MINPVVEPRYYDKKARQIRAQVSIVLKRWGLLPRFKRWRLAQDPGTGMVVLFGILNNRFIAMHTSTPFSDYFDPRLLHDLSEQLQVNVVSCSGDGLRYAFVLERGQVAVLPTHIEYPYVESDRLVVRVVYEPPPVIAVMEPPAVMPVPQSAVDDQTLVQRGVGAFLKVFDDIKLREDAAEQPAVQPIPPIVVIDRREFNRRVGDLQANR